MATRRSHPQPRPLGTRQPGGARSIYDEAKRAAEAFTMAYHNLMVWTPDRADLHT